MMTAFEFDYIPSEFDIRMPKVSIYGSNPAPVLWSSPLAHRRAVYRIARHFKREFGYDLTQYGVDGKETDRACVAYLWHAPNLYSSGPTGVCFGATCFRFREEGGWAMQWIWIHPYMRSRGVLSRSWDMFEAQHPNFGCEPPLSKAMLAFLEKRGHSRGIKGWHVEYVRGLEK